MITTRTITVDTYARQASPDSNYGGVAYGATRVVGGNEVRAFLWSDRPFPVGATIFQAKLRLHAQGAWTSHTMHVRRVTTKWIESGVGSLTWNKMPSVGTTDVAIALGAIADKALVELDVTTLVQEIAAGNPFYGFRLVGSDGTTRYWYSGEASDSTLRPQLLIEWSTPPSPPTDLVPSGGRVISLQKPYMDWKFVDSKGESQLKFQIQIDDDPAFGSTLFDSGWVTSSDSAIDLSDATYAFSGLALNTTYYWRVRVQDSYGLASGWSSTQSFIRKTKGTVTITNPPDPPSNTVDDQTPPITHTFSATQTAVQYILERDDGGFWTELYDSGIRATTDTTFTLPEKLITSTAYTYRITVRVYDDQDRQSMANDPRYAEDQQSFTFVRTGIAAVLTLTVTPRDNGDLYFEWTRTAQPDYWAFTVNGVAMKGYERVPSADALVSAPNYAYTIKNGYRLRVAQTFEVEAVVLSAGKLQHSSGNPTVSVTPKAKNIWLKCPSKGLECIVITDPDRHMPEAQLGESAETFFPIGRRDPVRIIDAIRGLEGQVTGMIAEHADGGGTARDSYYWRNQLESIKSWQGKADILLVLADRVFEVELGDITYPPSVKGDSVWFPVTIQYWQKDQFFVPLR